MSVEDQISVADHDKREAAETTTGNGISPIQNASENAGGRPLHRLAAARKQQGFSLINMARRLGVDVATVLEQEQETTDLPLNTIYAWQKILDVPVVDLLVDSNGPLSSAVHERARLVRLMKTATAIREKVRGNSLLHKATMLIEQLVEIMPELREVSAWNAGGQRRTRDDYGRIIERQLPADLVQWTIY
jgi:transcriptional regulator with XRE-family HTH domain